MAKNKEYNGSTPITGPYAELQEAFVDNIIAGLPQYEAYRKAGYKGKNDAIIMSNSSTLLKRNKKVIRRLAYKRAQLAKKAEITAEKVIKEFACIGLVDIAQIYDDNGNIKDIEDIPEETRRAIAGIEHIAEYDNDGNVSGYTKKLKFWDKNKALENLGKHLGLYELDNAQRGMSIVEILAIVGGNAAMPVIEGETGEQPLLEGTLP